MADEMVMERELWRPGEIIGRRVVLRRHRPENLATVYRWYRDPEVARLTRYQTRPMPRDEVERFFQTRLLGPDSVAYAIHIRLTDRLVGLTTFSSLDPDNGSVSFHITLGERDVWGQGYGTEAACLMLGHAFERLGLHRVGLSVFSFNERAIRSYEKAGFRIEGRLRDAIARDGRYWDEIQMGALRPEWLERSTPEPALHDHDAVPGRPLRPV
ncbi:MAG: GNAT family N-acetyltransferase [Chloroflexi bacterium]|nr:GNAT family N-acetyltransferase [Chloroflexota bacterium]MDQ3448557.1 GNAT family N-acetyltransferase [Chloroflexota bacterium]